MNAEDAKRIERLEILFSEQEYTIQTLNDIVTVQADKIDRLEMIISALNKQIKSIQETAENQSSNFSQLDEKPPHY